jgi:hypothetical protein
MYCAKESQLPLLEAMVGGQGENLTTIASMALEGSSRGANNEAQGNKAASWSWRFQMR